MNYVINLLIILAISMTAHGTMTMRFKPLITQQAQYVSDILSVHPHSHRLESIQLDSHPVPGQTITQDQLINWLTHQTGPFKYLWRGKKTAHILSNAPTKSQDLIALAQTALINQLKNQYHSIEVHAISHPRDSDLPLQQLYVVLPDSEFVSKRMCVRLKHNKISIPVWFSIKAYQKVLVAKQRISKNNTINPADFIWRDRNITNLNHKPYVSAIENKWLIKTINKNQVLTVDHLAEKPDVLKGHAVLVNVRHKTISIKAIAQKNGYQGESIPMRNTASGKIFIAVVTEKNQAEAVS